MTARIRSVSPNEFVPGTVHATTTRWHFQAFVIQDLTLSGFDFNAFSFAAIFLYFYDFCWDL